MKRNIYKVTLLHMDLNNNGPLLINERLDGYEFTKVMDVEPREVTWDDGHPLNADVTQRQAFDELFAPPPSEPIAMYGDTELMDLMEAVNKRLEPHGLAFVDKSVEGHDHCLFVLEKKP